MRFALLLAATAPAAAYFRSSTTATRQPKSGSALPKFPKLRINQTSGIENEYQLNLGKAIDTLRRDYPNMLHDTPDFSIFTENIRLKSASSKKYRIEGIEQYAKVFEVLRFIRNTTMVHDEVGSRCVVSDGTIRVRWNAKLTMSVPFAALPGLKRDESGRPVLYVDGQSVYDVNNEGLVYKVQNAASPVASIAPPSPASRSSHTPARASSARLLSPCHPLMRYAAISCFPVRFLPRPVRPVAARARGRRGDAARAAASRRPRPLRLARRLQPTRACDRPSVSRAVP